MSEHNEENEVQGDTLLWINGREKTVHGELLLLDTRGEGLVLLIVTEPEDEAAEHVFVAAASVYRPDLKLRFTDENAAPLDGKRYAAETFAVFPAEVAAGIFRPDLLRDLSGGSPCGECPQCLAEADGAEEDRTS